MAIDSYDNALAWNGTSWSVAQPLGGQVYYPGISCASSSFCVTVSGGYVYPGSVWDGAVWTSLASSADQSEISCPSTSFCGAVNFEEGYIDQVE